MGYVDRDAHVSAARYASREPAFDLLAGKVKTTILGVAAPHNKTGDYARSIRIRTVTGAHGVQDKVIESTDPNALSIEYGHQWVTPEGKVIGYIKGLRIFNKAFNILKRGG